MQADLFQLLQKLNFTEYEAKAYLSLLEKSPLSGYAVALNSGVPRSKIYEVLSGMEKRGEVMVSHENPALYFPLSPKALLERKKQVAETTFNMAEQALKKYSVTTRNRENIWDITGTESILNQVKEVIRSAKKRILIEICSEDVEKIQTELKDDSDREVEIDIVAHGEISLDFAHIYRHDTIDDMKAEYGGRWIILSADDKEVVAGIVSLGAESRAAYTMHPGLVMPITEEIIHDIYISEILKKHRSVLESSFGTDLLKLRKRFNISSSAVKYWLNNTI